MKIVRITVFLCIITALAACGGSPAKTVKQEDYPVHRTQLAEYKKQLESREAAGEIPPSVPGALARTVESIRLFTSSSTTAPGR